MEDPLQVSLWGVEVEAVSCGGEAERPVHPHYRRDGDLVGFADGSPFLLLSKASLDDPNGRLKEPVQVDRFRPNVVIEGCAPYEEDGWRGVRMGGVAFRVVKPCSRA